MEPIELPIPELKTALTGFSKIIIRSVKLDVLRMIQVEHNTTCTTLTVTDLDRVASYTFDNVGGEHALFLASFDDLQQLAKKAPKVATVLLGFEKHRLVAHFKNSPELGEFPISTLPVGDFPALPQVDGPVIPFPSPLREAFNEAMMCSSTDETRYVLNSVFIDTSEKGNCYMVGTDGKRLYQSRSFALALEESVIVPSHKFFTLAAFNRGDWEISVDTLAVAENLKIKSGQWSFTTKLIQDNFPMWRSVVPDPDNTQVKLHLDPDSLGNILQIIKLLPTANKKDKAVALDWDATLDAITLAGRNQDGDWKPRQIPFRSAHGPLSMRICLNREFLASALELGFSIIDLIDAKSPLVFYHHMTNKKMVVMPVRV